MPTALPMREPVPWVLRLPSIKTSSTADNQTGSCGGHCLAGSDQRNRRALLGGTVSQPAQNTNTAVQSSHLSRVHGFGFMACRNST